MSHINLVPAGTILPFGGAAAPGGYIVCDGSSLLRAGVYAKLFAAIGTVWGTADGTHFNLPDMRGRFMRGHDDGKGTDPDAASRTASNTGGETGDKVGTVQDHEMDEHTHIQDAHKHTVFVIVCDPTADSGTTKRPVSGGILDTSETTATNQNTGGNETRPVNACVNYIIKI